MSDTNSIWPNGMQVDSEGYAVFYPMGTNKIEIPKNSPYWPKGNKIIGSFVYDKDDKLVGFCDTKAMTTGDTGIVVMPYEYIDTEFDSIPSGSIQVHAPKAVVKKASWTGGEKIDIPDVQYKYKGCKGIDDIKAVDENYLENDIIDGKWTELLSDLTDGANMFLENQIITSFESDLSSLTSGYKMFMDCSNLASFTSDLSSLIDGNRMFSVCKNLTSFTSDLKSLNYGYMMFRVCTNLEHFNGDLSSLDSGELMFYSCSNLTSFQSNMSSLTNANNMFAFCRNLTSFSANLKSLTNGSSMFGGCKLDTQSLKNIAETINTVTESQPIHIGIGNTTPTEEENSYLTQIHDKGWQVYVNGSSTAFTPTDGTSLIPIDGEQNLNPIPFWAKPVPSTQEEANYIDENGNYYNILGGQFIYVNDPESYGMFINEEDAAINMRLAKIV